jgi:hypothetical protein
MSTMLIDIAVGVTIFILGIALTIRRFGDQDYPVVILSAIVTPILAVIAMFYVIFLAIRGKNTLDPCPDGLEEAEKIVEIQRQQLFGGPARAPSISASWKQAYEMQLQAETRRVQKVARRYLAIPTR